MSISLSIGLGLPIKRQSVTGLSKVECDGLAMSS